jgi:cytochrome c2
MRQIILILVFLSGFLTFGQDYAKGKQLFNTHCASCHKMDKKLVGPALNTIVARQGEEWTKEWIYNNNALRASGDAYANQIYEEYNKMAMPGYQFLKDEELNDIVEYLAQWQTKKDEAAAAASVPAAPAAGGTVVVAQSEPSTWLYILLIVAAIMSLVGLYALHIGLKAIVKITTRGQSTNLYLMKKLDMDQENVDKEFDDMIEGEVDKRTKAKIKDFKKSVNKKLKGL